MRYRTHLMTSAVVALPLMVQTGTLTYGTALALSLGVLLPDIDEPDSWIGRRTRLISRPINRRFGHRGATHSLAGWAVVTLGGALLIHGLWYSLYFSLGYLLHLVEDSFSKSGIGWLLPWSPTLYKSGAGVVYYTTGRTSETVVLVVAVITVLMEVLWMGLG